MLFTKEFWLPALEKAIRTAFQTALGFMAVGMASTEIDWVLMGNVSLVAALVTICMSVAQGDNLLISTKLQDKEAVNEIINANEEVSAIDANATVKIYTEEYNENEDKKESEIING